MKSPTPTKRIDWLYLIQEMTDDNSNRCYAGHVKIGHGLQPTQRFNLAQTGNPRILFQRYIGIGGVRLENEFKEEFAALRIHPHKRSEWFHWEERMSEWARSNGLRPKLLRDDWKTSRKSRRRAVEFE